MLTILSIVLVVVVFVTPHLLIVDTFDSMFPRAVEAGNFYTIWRGMAFFPFVLFNDIGDIEKLVPAGFAAPTTA